ncbi:hypothetical protein N9F63_00460 [bacterium]|nr:hypothetical protein [bacterium]
MTTRKPGPASGFVLAATLCFSASLVAQTLSLQATNLTDTGFSLEVLAADMPAVIGAQGSLAFDPAALAFTGVEALGLPGMTPAQVSAPSPGALVFSWFDGNLSGQTPSTPLLRLSFAWQPDPSAETTLALTDTPAPTEWIAADFSPVEVTLGAPLSIASPFSPPDAAGFAMTLVAPPVATPGSSLELPIVADSTASLMSLQGSFAFDPALLTDVNLSPAALPLANWSSPTPGSLGFLWFSESLEPLEVVDGDTLFMLSATLAPSAIPGPVAIDFVDEPIPLEAILGNLGEAEPFAAYGAVFEVPAPVAVDTMFLGGADNSETAVLLNTAGTFDIPASWTGDLAAFQAGLAFDPTAFTVTGVTSPLLTGFDASHFTLDAAAGELAVAWFDPSGAGVTAAPGTPLLTLQVVGDSAGVHEVVWSAEVLPLEAANASGQTFPLQASTNALTIVESMPADAAFALEGSWNGGSLAVDVIAMTNIDLLSFQASFGFNPSALGFTGVTPGELSSIGSGDCNQPSPGVLACAWFDNSLVGLELIQSDTLFTFSFDVVGAPDSLVMTLGGDPVAFEVVGPGFVPYNPIDLTATFFPSTSACEADLDGDCTVDMWDLLVFLAGYGCIAPPDCPGDFNGNGVVNSSDLLVLLTGFGTSTCCE